MYFHTHTGTHVTSGLAFTIGSNQYPADWFLLATPEDVTKHGFVPVVDDGVREDESKFFVSESLDGPFRRIINTPKPTEMLGAVDRTKREDFLTTFRKLREQVLDRLGGIAGRATGRLDPEKNDPALREACLIASEALLDITKDLPSDMAGTVAAMESRYTVIALTAIKTSPILETAFAKIDQ